MRVSSSRLCTHRRGSRRGAARDRQALRASPQALAGGEVVPLAPPVLVLEEADRRLVLLDDGTHTEALHRGVRHLRWAAAELVLWEPAWGLCRAGLGGSSAGQGAGSARRRQRPLACVALTARLPAAEPRPCPATHLLCVARVHAQQRHQELKVWVAGHDVIALDACVCRTAGLCLHARRTCPNPWP